MRENEGVAAPILLDFDADSEKIRNDVIRMLSGPGGRRQGDKVAMEEEQREVPLASTPRPVREWLEFDALRANLPLTRAVRRAFEFALALAVIGGERQVRPTHLLLALLRTYELKSVWQVAAADLDLLEPMLGRRPLPWVESRLGMEERQLDPPARRALDLALAHALVRGDEKITSLSLLAGLAQLDDSALRETMKRLGIDRAKLLDEIGRRSRPR